MEKAEGHGALSCWFGLSYASFCTLPRVLMEGMPDEWQWKMAQLLTEYNAEWEQPAGIGTRVQVTQGGRIVKTPDWIVNYRHPDRGVIESMRGIQK